VVKRKKRLGESLLKKHNPASFNFSIGRKASRKDGGKQEEVGDFLGNFA
jgi:hypothetical protein